MRRILTSRRSKGCKTVQLQQGESGDSSEYGDSDQDPRQYADDLKLNVALAEGPSPGQYVRTHLCADHTGKQKCAVGQWQVVQT